MEKRKKLFQLSERYDTLNRAIDEKWLTTYVYYCHIFRKNTRFFHSVKYKQVAVLCRISPQTASFHVKKMIEVGLCKMNGNQLQRIKQNTKSKRRFLVPNVQLKDLKVALEAQLMFRNLNQQQYCINRQIAIMNATSKVKSNKPCSKKEIKLSQKSLSRSFCKETVMSGYRYAQLIGKHYITAYKRIKKLAELQLIKVNKRYDEISCDSYSLYIKLKRIGIIPPNSRYISSFRVVRISKVSSIQRVAFS